MNTALSNSGMHSQPSNTVQKLATVNEQTWITVGNLAEMMGDHDKAINSYESALRHNPYSIVALSQIASIYRAREQLERAVDYFKRVLAIQDSHGDTWAALGHCYLMSDNLQEAYQAYQQALYHLQNPKDAKLWYGIGILYDRYGSLEHAEEAFSAVMKMDPQFEKASEVYFRLGIIYKQQRKFDPSLQYFQYVLQHPPSPLIESDIWFQIGHVHEQKKEYDAAKEAYEHVLSESPDHAKVLQQLGWLYHQPDTSFTNQKLATELLTKSISADSADAQSWYLLGRCYMAEQNYTKAYESYQQAVYRDARNPIFWCSIGVLYYQINQYRDALDAYSRAIRLNPYISEVWYDLGTLYESCNNQVQDALDAYQRALELDPNNAHIQQRIDLLKKPVSGSAAPVPQDVTDPSQYVQHAAGSGSMLPYGQGPRQVQQKQTDHRDIADRGGELPGLSKAEARANEVSKQLHIPDINGRRPSLSPPSANAHMNPMLINSAPKEEPRSPKPSFVANRNTNGNEDEEMTEAGAHPNKTSPNVKPEDEEMN
ncbi:uncharacterized protein ATC70_011165 [Mucor velutinosus]|uniref:Uncharacterized protein n=1 Tax=Mucor velutinosus TaxID=708070 RepID=A0AAN7DEX5_9FUNG|nr:hypothetical protein ATC70_011165 [Mucor velutinosus]